MNTPRLYWRYTMISLRSQMAYRANFILYALSNLLITVAEFLGVWALFARFGGLKGWALPQAAMLYGMSNMSFAIAEAIPRGFDVFPRLVRSGDFDRMLLRPRGLAFQAVAHQLQLMRIGRLSQGAVVLAWGASAAGIDWDVSKVAMLAFAVAGGACLFSGLFVLGATMSFWTTESLEIVNITTYGGSYACEYPLTVYRPWFRAALTFGLPLATVNYLPAHVLLNRPEVIWNTPAWMQVASPLVGVAFLVVCLQVFRLGVRKYTSTGS